MQRNKANDFNAFLSEADLRGNIGIPGEEGSGRPSWLDKIKQSSDRSARDFAMQNRADIQNFQGLVMRSKQLQRGHEQELSDLATEAVKELYGSLLDDVELDLKIETRQGVKQEMEETPTEMTDIEEIEDEEVINQIHKRKILRTIQQGKGLSVKAILNLSIFKEGLSKILGNLAEEYLTTLNKISAVAQFFDWDMPEEMQKGMWQSREGFSGSCDIKFDDEPSQDEDLAQKVLDNLANGQDITDSEEAEELISGVGVTVRARGVDLSVLLHESIKGIYALITQASLEALYGGSAEKVVANTDTLLDELQEIKYGRQMQDVFFKIVADHPRVKEVVESLVNTDSSDMEISSFQEKINFLFFGKIAMMGQENAKEMLDIVNAILSESPEATELCDPIIEEVLSDLNQEDEYQRSLAGGSQEERYEDEEEDETTTTGSKETQMSQDELNNAIINAYEEGDMEEVRRLRGLLGESQVLSFQAWKIINS